MKFPTRNAVLSFLFALGWLLSFSCEGREVEAVDRIEAGTSFGECLGYCFSELMIEGTTANLSEYGHDKERVFLEKSIEGSIGSDEWNLLNELLNIELFYSLDDVIGCPDCRDQGAEWIRIIHDGSSKEVIFEFGETIDGMEAFLDRVRTIRERFHQELFPRP